MSGPDRHRSRREGGIGNNAADKIRVCKSDLLPHLLDRRVGQLIVTAG
jgi:hypothetical protein